MNDDDLKIIEALIFASPDPISLERLAGLAGISDSNQIKAGVDKLNRQYAESGRAFMIVVGGGGYRFATRSEFSRWIRKLVLGSARLRLSRAALETISIIAYRQPISRAKIETLRGVDTGGILKMLLERKLIQVRGRGSGPGRPLLYSTTSDFLTYFGLNSLEDLPKPEELADEDHRFSTAETLFETGDLVNEENSST